MNTFAPEFRALMTILRSTGPVISTRRSRRSAGIGRDLPLGFADRPRFRAGNPGILPATISCCRSTRRWRSAAGSARNAVRGPATNRQRRRVSGSPADAAVDSPRTSMPSGWRAAFTVWEAIADILPLLRAVVAQFAKSRLFSDGAYGSQASVSTLTAPWTSECRPKYASVRQCRGPHRKETPLLSTRQPRHGAPGRPRQS